MLTGLSNLGFLSSVFSTFVSIEAIALVYASKNYIRPFGVWTHSTGSVASSWAWAKGMSIQVASLSSQNIFARFLQPQDSLFCTACFVCAVRWHLICY